MTRSRVPETDSGIQGVPLVDSYDRMQRRLRDRGWLETRALVSAGITHGRALEIGPGPGYLGLDWLKSTQDTRLTGLDISPDMVELATRNARDSGLGARCDYVLGEAARMPFADASFDAVFSAGSLHEWVDVPAVLVEVVRVLRPGGRALVLDMRRDMTTPLRWFLSANATSPQMRRGLMSSIAAAYTPAELVEITGGMQPAWSVSSTAMGLQMSTAVT